MRHAAFDNLVILEMANNHMGDLAHGIKLIREFGKAVSGYNFKFALKFQYRDLDSLIHPDFKTRMDIKYIKRFSETRISENDFLSLKREAEQCGFLVISTPFDEKSVEMIERHDYPLIKIASCSFNDWPLLERIAASRRPVVASTAGAVLTDIDNVVSFFAHREIPLCLMHCVGSYPTPDAELELNQIDFFKERYPGVAVGFSTHEAPDNFEAVLIALGKGAAVFERHIGLDTPEYPINAYSSTPEQIGNWLAALRRGKAMCGVEGRRRDISEKEHQDLLGLRRGMFVTEDIAAGTAIDREKMFFAMPNRAGQLTANDCSKYRKFVVRRPLKANEPVMNGDIELIDTRARVLDIVRRLCGLIRVSGVRLRDKLDLELSHHYGLEQFDRFGCSIITCVNREYCKKIILVLPGQENPSHEHHKKEETFHVLYGDIELTLDGRSCEYSAGDIIVVERGKQHSFASRNGAVLEEISTTHYANDSFYADTKIAPTSERKTYMTFYADWLDKEALL